LLETNLALLILAFIFGSIIGSFLNVCIYRLPRGESVVFPSSYCPLCKAPIRFYDNIPILSYILLRGRCRACGVKISPQYVIVETLSGISCALILWRFGLRVEAAFYFVFIAALIVVTFIDLEHKIIPDVVTIPLLVIGLLWAALRTNWGVLKFLTSSVGGFWDILFIIDKIPITNSLLGAILGAAMLWSVGFIYEKLRGREGMGMGDVKLLAMMGAFLGWSGVIFVTLIGSFLGTVVGLSLVLFKGKDLKYAVPFGPFLSVGGVIYFVFSNVRF